MITGQQLMRVYGALMWSLGKVLGTPEVIRVYIGSFWDKPYSNDEYKKIFEAEQSDLLKDLYALPKNAAVRKINELVKRARKAKAHAYVLSYLKEQMPAMFGKQKKQEEMIEGLRNIFITVHQRWQLPVGDFPDITKFREALKAQPDFTKFAKLNEKMIQQMDEVLANDIPKLMQQFPHERDAYKTNNPFEYTSPFDNNGPLNEGPITSDERAQSREIFNTLGPVNGKITGKSATTILMQSKLPRETLSKLWVLADRDKDGMLTEEEFIIALWLVRQVLDGKKIPLALPAALQQSVQTQVPQVFGQPQPQQLQQQAPQQQQQTYSSPQQQTYSSPLQQSQPSYDQQNYSASSYTPTPPPKPQQPVFDNIFGNAQQQQSPYMQATYQQQEFPPATNTSPFQEGF